jgi:hypothetical protein
MPSEKVYKARRRSEDAFAELDAEMRNSPEGDNPLERDEVVHAIADTVATALKSKRTGVPRKAEDKELTVKTTSHGSRTADEKVSLQIFQLKNKLRNARGNKQLQVAIKAKIEELKKKMSKKADSADRGMAGTRKK